MSTTSLLPRPAQEAPRSSSGKGRGSNDHQPTEPKRTWRRTLLWALTVGIAFGAGWMLANRVQSHDERDVLPPEAGTSDRDSSVMVTVAPVSHRSVQRTVEGMGTLHGFEEVIISARVEGRVHKLNFDVGDYVEPGRLLLEIDPTDLALSVQQAEWALQAELAKFGLTDPPSAEFDVASVPSVVQARVRMENAKSTLDRLAQLISQRAATVQEHEDALNRFRTAQAEYDNQNLLAKAGLATIQLKGADLAVARQQLKYTELLVPIPTLPVPGATDGVVYAVTDRTVAEGTLVRSGTEICKLAIVQTLNANVPVPERYSTAVHVGQTAEVHTAAFPHPFTGTVTRINPAVDPLTRTFEVEIQIPNHDGDLKPGSFAKATILTHMDTEAATVPLTALVNSEGIDKIFLAENERAKEVQVTLGVQTTQWVEITAPALPRDAQVITSGQTVLAAETPVVLRDESTEASFQVPAEANQAIVE
ncbi:MAG TPA: efflux RND transporter periplasmic adaptor subunit [Nitrospiraceae bacterium]|nr:efflux RND transporter periplasmic adaptor subunit [Nitrospiraceae bacterium]